MTKKSGIEISVRFLNIFLLSYLVLYNIVPSVFNSVIYFFKPFMDVYFVFYSIIITVFAILLIFSVIMQYIITYSNKLNKLIKNEIINNYKFYKAILLIIEKIIIVYFASIYGLIYISIINSIMIIFSIFSLFTKRDLIAKVTKLNLIKE